MGSFTGRRSTGRLKSFGGMLLDGLDAMATASHDSTRRTRIVEIENQLESLSWERNQLISELIEPFEGRKVDDDFDPRRRPVSQVSDNGRLTKCKGAWSDGDPFNETHPGCPYKGMAHGGHEFTLRD